MKYLVCAIVHLFLLDAGIAMLLKALHCTATIGSSTFDMGMDLTFFCTKHENFSYNI